MKAFADRLIEKCRSLEHCLCVGLDPHVDKIPPLFARGSMSLDDPETVGAVESFLLAVLELLHGKVPAVKPQSAFYEQLGVEGIGLLRKVNEAGRATGAEVILDAKRGDIGSTAAAYARAYLRNGAALEVDALTVNPYLGVGSLKPFVDMAAENQKGLFVLAKTSNPESAELQNQSIDGVPLYGVVADRLAADSEQLEGAETGWSGLGVVVGATTPEEALAVRGALGRGLFLVPGLGAQGGSAQAAVHGFSEGPAGLEGGVVSSSRGILFPESAQQATSVAEWESAMTANLDATIAELRSALKPAH